MMDQTDLLFEFSRRLTGPNARDKITLSFGARAHARLGRWEVLSSGQSRSAPRGLRLQRFEVVVVLTPRCCVSTSRLTLKVVCSLAQDERGVSPETDCEDNCRLLPAWRMSQSQSSHVWSSAPGLGRLCTPDLASRCACLLVY